MSQITEEIMERQNALDQPIVTDYGISVLRIFVGTALLIRGIFFMMNMQLLNTLTMLNMPFLDFMASHYVIFAHVIGGFCLTLGLLTRWSAACNIPVILGAIIFVHAQEGLFQANLGLELTIFLLVVLSVIAITGSKVFAVDNYFKVPSKEKVYLIQPKHNKEAA